MLMIPVLTQFLLVGIPPDYKKSQWSKQILWSQKLFFKLHSLTTRKVN